MVDIRPSTKITLDLVSPERLVLSQPVDMAVLPGSEGMFAVLAGHAPLVAMLRPGVIDVYDDARITTRIFVGGGFAEVTAERCVVLAEAATPLAEIDRAQVTAEIDRMRVEGAAETSTPDARDTGRWTEIEIRRAMLDALDSKPL